MGRVHNVVSSIYSHRILAKRLRNSSSIYPNCLTLNKILETFKPKNCLKTTARKQTKYTAPMLAEIPDPAKILNCREQCGEE